MEIDKYQDFNCMKKQTSQDNYLNIYRKNSILEIFNISKILVKDITKFFMLLCQKGK